MFIRAVGLAWLLINTVSASYVQARQCEDAADAQFDPASLHVVMVPRDHDNLVTLTVQFWAELEQCRALADDLTVHVEMEALGWSMTLDDPEATANCTEKYSRTLLETAVSGHLGGLYPLATYNTRARLLDPNGRQVACIKGNVVPAHAPATSAALRWAPFAVLMAVLAVGIALTVHDQRVALIEQDADAVSDRPLLPRVGDCLQYLQFMFLTGSLSIQYPGFFQPAVSRLEWYSLFSTVPVARGGVYNGVNDGIYEMNGTYGGTYGLELMHQIVGAPKTMDTWLNMVLTLLFIAIGAAIFLECLLWWQRRSYSHVFQPAAEPTNSPRQRFSRVLRIIFSYFTMPAVAISSYQLANASFLPKYHTALATILIVLIAAGFVWLLCKVPTRSLGVLVFDGSKRYQPLPTGDAPTHQRHRGFVLVLFILAFIRGAAIGGLQLFGLAQLAILGACELVLLASIYGFQAHSLYSVNTVAALCRLSTLVLMVFFLPGILAVKTKSAIGYAILAIHAGMLIFGFFGTACYDVWHLCRTWPRSPQPDAYGLRDLRRRDNSALNLSAAHLRSPSVRSAMPERPFSPPEESRASLYEGSITDTDRYFRAPRPSSLRSNKSVDLSPFGASQISSDTRTLRSPRPASRAVSPLAGKPVSYFTPFEEYNKIPNPTGRSSNGTSSESGTRSSSSSQDSETYVSPTISEECGDDLRPLGPRWKDYTFRESDLIYGAPRPAASRDWGDGGRLAADSNPPTPSERPPSSLRKVSSGMWSKLTGRGDQEPVEKGFSVSRPPRVEPGQALVPEPSNGDRAGHDTGS